MELLAEDFADAESPRDRRAAAKIAVVQRECQRLQDLLDDFLNFAKVRTVRFEAVGSERAGAQACSISSRPGARGQRRDRLAISIPICPASCSIARRSTARC